MFWSVRFVAVGRYSRLCDRARKSGDACSLEVEDFSLFPGGSLGFEILQIYVSEVGLARRLPT